MSILYLKSRAPNVASDAIINNFQSYFEIFYSSSRLATYGKMRNQKR